MFVRVTVAGRVGVGDAGLGGLARTAFAYLVCARQRPVARDELAEVLWAEDLPSSWEQLVRGLTSKIRAAVAEAGLDGATFLTSAFGALQVHLPAGAVVDVEEAEADLEAATAALAAGDAATARSRGSAAAAVAARQFLPGATGTWVERRQAELRELHLRALEVVARAATAERQWGEAVAAAEEAITLEPFRESAYLALMSAHAGAGSRGEALRAYERCRRVLAEELGVSPSARTEEAYQALLGEEPPASAGAFALPGSLMTAGGEFLVGREPEVDRLEVALKRATVEGRQAVFVAGEPGIGKTTLVAHFTRGAHAGGARVLYGRCDEELGLPYQPFAEAMAHFVAEAPLGELEAHVAVHGAELARLVPELHRRVPSAPAVPVTDPEADRYRLFNAVASLLASASRPAPVVLVLDDLHWAAPPTLSLLRHVLHATAAAKVLVVGTYRHTDVGPEDGLARTLADLRREPPVDRLQLRRLDEDAVAAFVRAAASPAWADGDDLSLARALHAHTAGNPFFVGELLRHLGETGATFRRSGSWSYYAAAQELGVPEGVREVVGRRLQRLSEPAREALRWGAIIGADFDLELLEAVGGSVDGDALLDAVEEAVRDHLVVERGAGRYGFAHALVRDTIQAEFTATRRARRHLAVAEALDALRRDHARRLPALVHHFAEAGTPAAAIKAADYALAAARQAFAQSAWEDAVAFLERALDALDVHDDPDPERRCDLLLMLAETWCRFWDVPKMRQAAEQAVQVARSLRSRERLGQAARWYMTSGPVPTDIAHEALALLGEDFPALRALILARMALAEEDEAMSREALARARRSGDSEALGVALRVRCSFLSELGPASERLAIAEELVSAAPPGGWDGWRGGYEQRAIARLVVGDRQGFEADAAATARLGREGHFWYYERYGALWRATLALMNGEFEDVPRLADAAGALEPVTLPPGRLGDLHAIQLSKLALERGQFEKAVALLQAALVGVPAHPILRAMLASAMAEIGHAGEARQQIQTLVQRVPRFMVATLAYVAETASALGDNELAASAYDELRRFAGLVVASGQVAHCPGSADRYLGQLASTLHRWDDAEAHFETALRVDEGLAAPPLLARTRYWYGRMLVERGGAEGANRAGDLLTESLETAETLRMEAVAGRARELLDHL